MTGETTGIETDMTTVGTAVGLKETKEIEAATDAPVKVEGVVVLVLVGVVVVVVVVATEIGVEATMGALHRVDTVAVTEEEERGEEEVEEIEVGIFKGVAAMEEAVAEAVEAVAEGQAWPISREGPLEMTA